MEIIARMTREKKSAICWKPTQSVIGLVLQRVCQGGEFFSSAPSVFVGHNQIHQDDLFDFRVNS